MWIFFQLLTDMNKDESKYHFLKSFEQTVSPYYIHALIAFWAYKAHKFHFVRFFIKFVIRCGDVCHQLYGWFSIPIFSAVINLMLLNLIKWVYKYKEMHNFAMNLTFLSKNGTKFEIMKTDIQNAFNI